MAICRYFSQKIENNMAEETQPELRIDKLAGKDNLKTAFEQFESFSKLYNGLQYAARNLQGQLAELERKTHENLVKGEDERLQRNNIRHGFLAELDEFKQELTHFFDLSEYTTALQGVTKRMDVVQEVLAQRFRKHYEIERQIKEGDSTLVFCLRDLFSGRQVVAKVLKKPELQEDIREEIRQVARLKHRNIIKLLDESLDQFPFFIICEYVNGASINDVLVKFGPRPPSQAVDWLYELADALSYLRQKKILHANVRPSKIYIDDEQHVMISPFDIIKAGMEERTLRKFREDCQYLSPELLAGDGEKLPLESMRASDQFSLGLIAFKILTGKDLFEGRSVQETIKNRTQFFENETYRRARIALVNSDELGIILTQMLQENPKNRYYDLHDLLLQFHSLSRKEEDSQSVVRNSYRRCMGSNKEFIGEFYDAFVEKTPALAQQFTNRERQHAMFQMAVDVLIDIDVKAELLQQMIGGKSAGDKPNHHAQYGLPFFKDFLDTLIITARKNDARLWSPDIESAWQAVRDKSLTVIESTLTEASK